VRASSIPAPIYVNPKPISGQDPPAPTPLSTNEDHHHHHHYIMAIMRGGTNGSSRFSTKTPAVWVNGKKISFPSVCFPFFFFWP